MKKTPIYFQVSEKYGFLKTRHQIVGQHRQVPELSAVHFKDSAEEDPNLSLDLVSQPSIDDRQNLKADMPLSSQDAAVLHNPDVLFGKKETEPILTPELMHTLGELVSNHPGASVVQNMIRTFLNAGLSLRQVSEILKLSPETLTRGLN